MDLLSSQLSQAIGKKRELVSTWLDKTTFSTLGDTPGKEFDIRSRPARLGLGAQPLKTTNDLQPAKSTLSPNSSKESKKLDRELNRAKYRELAAKRVSENDGIKRKSMEEDDEIDSHRINIKQEKSKTSDIYAEFRSKKKSKKKS